MISTSLTPFCVLIFRRRYRNSYPAFFVGIISEIRSRMERVERSAERWKRREKLLCRFLAAPPLTCHSSPDTPSFDTRRSPDNPASYHLLLLVAWPRSGSTIAVWYVIAHRQRTLRFISTTSSLSFSFRSRATCNARSRCSITDSRNAIRFSCSLSKTG